MGLLDYLREQMNKPYDPTNQFGQYGLQSPISVGDILTIGTGMVPGIGDVLSATEAIDSAGKGNYKEALFDSLGILPFIPAMGGVIRKADNSLSLIPPKIGPAISDKPKYLAERAANIIKRNHAKTMGTVDDPVYGMIKNSDNPDNIINYLDLGKSLTDEELRRFNVSAYEFPGYDRFKRIGEALRKQAGTTLGEGTDLQRAIENRYDHNLAVNAYPLHQRISDNMPEQYMGMLKNPENESKLVFEQPAFLPSRAESKLYQDTLLKRMKRGAISPQNVKDVRFTLPDMMKWADEEKEIAAIKRNKERLKEVEPIKEYPDGYRWVKINKPSALKAEGSVMNHCVGEYSNRVKSGFSEIWSLRDQNNIPHVTIETDPKNNLIKQEFGKSNSSIKKVYMPYVNDFKQQFINK